MEPVTFPLPRDATGPALRESLNQLYQQGHRRILVDCRNCPFFDVVAAMALTSVARKCRAEGGDLRMFGLSPSLRALVLGPLGMNELALFEDQAQASNSFSSMRPKPAPPFEIEHEQRSGYRVVHMRGRFEEAGEVQPIVQLMRQGGGPLVLECSQMYEAESEPLMALKIEGDRFIRAGERLLVVPPRQGVLSVLWALGATPKRGLFTAAPTSEMALSMPVRPPAAPKKGKFKLSRQDGLTLMTLTLRKYHDADALEAVLACLENLRAGQTSVVVDHRIPQGDQPMLFSAFKLYAPQFRETGRDLRGVTFAKDWWRRHGMQAFLTPEEAIASFQTA